MTIELTITIKDEEKRKLSKAFLIYDSFTLSEHDPVVVKYLEECLDEFKGEPDTVNLRATMSLQ